LKQEVINDINNLDTISIYKKYLLGQDVWYFKQKEPDKYLQTYDTFKHYVVNSLEINFNNISIVGSAKTGISLSPEKDFKMFDTESDFDLVLVSPNLFYQFWDAYLDLFREKKNFGYKFVTSNIFRRFISIKRPDPNHSTFKNWIERVENFNKDYQVLFNIDCEINYRIYDSWESVEKYHFKGIDELKEKLNNGTNN
jgi:hypothetical protein